MGDFNSVSSVEERVGARVRNGDIIPSKFCMELCMMSHIKYT